MEERIGGRKSADVLQDEKAVPTSIMGSWPLTCTFRCVFFKSTTRSLAFRLPGMGTLTSASVSVWVHLYGSLACSSSSRFRSSSSFFRRSEGVGELSRDIVQAITARSGGVFWVQSANTMNSRVLQNSLTRLGLSRRQSVIGNYVYSEIKEDGELELSKSLRKHAEMLGGQGSA